MIVLFELSNIQLKEKIMSIENKENLKKIYNRSLEDFLDENDKTKTVTMGYITLALSIDFIIAKKKRLYRLYLFLLFYNI